MESQNPSIANLTLKNKAGVLTLRDSKIYLRAIKLKKKLSTIFLLRQRGFTK